ncbi:hypothetical protein BYT27DRAFT_7250444 [Phlegmacium glaucopus]|nr:hypothetical protein BYT27DRAFT_7250444 [Phlegmacium glaucopus]
MAPFKQPEIDHSKGRAFLQNRIIYYSPNSTRPITVPTRTAEMNSSYRFHHKDALWQGFHDPQWWTLPYCFLGFVPLRPSFEGDTFESLRDIVSFMVGPDCDGQYYLHEDKMALWTELQDRLFYISHLLDTRLDTYPALKPIPPLSRTNTDW